MIFVKKGIGCKISRIGHNNFFYPSDSIARVSRDSEVSILSWVNFNSGLIPVKIKTQNLIFYGSKENPLGYSVVWVEEFDVVKEQSNII
jgi:hypothetical protein